MSGKRRRDEELSNSDNIVDDCAETAPVLVHGAGNDQMQECQIVDTATKGARRPISPPPLRRRKLATDEPSHGKIQLTEQMPHKAIPNRSLPNMYQKDRGRVIYMNWSEEAELSIMTNQPYLLGIPDAQPDPPDELRANVDEVLSEAARTMKKDTGGIITVDYVDTTVEPRRREFDTSHLCDRCQKVIKESSVMNRPWRRIVNTRSVGSTTIHEEEPVEYHGQKCNVFGHHAQLGALRKSARAGCHLCSLLDAYDSDFTYVYDESDRKPYVLKVIYAKNHDEGPGVLALQAKGLPTKATYLMFEETKYEITGTLEHDRTDLEDVLAMGRQWLKTCTETHKACGARSEGESTFLPTRLVKVIGDGRSAQSISLSLRDEISPGTKYLTLSHCWGGADIVKLTEASLKDFQTDIPLSRLPKNFLDAVHVTTALEYEYIWIDSLCIIQDSAQDWKREAATMGSVYLYSECTIAAISSKDSYGGCFTTRSAQSFMPCQLIPKSDARPGVYAENWQHQPEPLHTRAWVVQERALSVRTLNFGAHMISWDCISAKASEREPDMESTSRDISLKRTFNNLLDYDVSQPVWTNSWWKLVTEYSRCNLSFVKDKWTAMEGMALEIEKSSSQNLAHGLWEFNITDELLWTVSRPKKERLDIGKPSWSWLSIDGVVHRRRYNYALDFRLDARAFVWRKSSSSSEAGTKNEIGIKTRMLPLRWTLRAIEKDNTPSYNFYLVDDRPGSSQGRPGDWYGRWIPDTVANESWETWSLQIVAADTLQLKGSAGLVVVPVEGRENAWKRVGFYEINWRDESHCDDSVPMRWFGDEKKAILV
jgi:hypothetical protein